MQRLTLGTIRDPVASVLNVCSTDPSVVTYTNRAERRLVARGKWVGTVARYRICASADGCLVWPRFIDTIEDFWRCNTPGTVRNGWYEASPSGPGLLNGNGACQNLLADRGTLPTFDTITGTTSRVAVRADVTEDADARILLRGYNQIGEWIRTQDNGVWIDGEYVSISTTTQYTTNIFASVVNVIKPVTNGPVRMWQFDVPTATVIRQLAFYEADETLPIYRASLVPGISSETSCGPCGCSCETGLQITVIAKLRHIDVANDTDFLLLGNEGAITLAVQAILKEERNLLDEAKAYWLMAISELEAELATYEGDGAVPVIKMESSRSWGAGVLNTVTYGGRIY